MTLSKDHIQTQSLLAFNAWKTLWIKNCKANKEKIKTSHKDFLGRFKGKRAFLFAYGPSFKANIEEFKAKYQSQPDIIVGCVDKAFRPLVALGVIPDYVLVADGSVDAGEWLSGISVETLKKTILIANVYCSPAWPEMWCKHNLEHSILWYLNKDNIECTKNNKCGTAEYFAPICGYNEIIEAGSNVGNSLVIFANKIFGSKELFLYAYDYCWRHGEYYGVEAHQKRYLTPSFRVVDNCKELAFSTMNMEFSAKWLDSYIIFVRRMYGVVTKNLTGRGILREGRLAA